MKFAINGRFTARKQTGQERFAMNIVLNLDKICKKNEFVLVVPKYAKYVPKLENIDIVYYGGVKRDLWEQISFNRYLKKEHIRSINLTTTCSYFRPDIVCLHDLFVLEFPKAYTTFYSKLSRIWHKILLKSAIKKSAYILTVSEYSRKKINEFFPKFDKNKILVLGNGWDHFNSITPSTDFFIKNKNIVPKNYYFAASSIVPRKNFKWVLEVAKRNPNDLFVIAGRKKSSDNDEMEKISNVIYTGYISDEEMKELMVNAKAYLQPSLYEGFGITPLEALSCHTPIIISPCTCFPEIYGNTAHYIDPYNYDVNLDKILTEPVSDPKEILEKFQWNNITKTLYDFLTKNYNL